MLENIKMIFLKLIQDVLKVLLNKEFYTYILLELKLRWIPRFTDCHVRVHGWDLYIPDSASFLFAYRSIFFAKIYAFKSDNPSPKILDLGANVGLSVLFFKYLYPQAQIKALEADPAIFEYLVKNVHGNGLTDVELINKAAWTENTKLSFHSGGDDSGHIILEDKGGQAEIEAVDTSLYLKNEQFDFLKMDIEGAEEHIIPACGPYLSGIKYVFVEYHSQAGRKQRLDSIIHTLSEAGFRLHIYSEMSSVSPFTELKLQSGFDLQLNIFAWREDVSSVSKYS